MKHLKLILILLILTITDVIFTVTGIQLGIMCELNPTVAYIMSVAGVVPSGFIVVIVTIFLLVFILYAYNKVAKVKPRGAKIITMGFYIILALKILINLNHLYIWYIVLTCGLL